MRETYRFKRTPYLHQVKAIKATLKGLAKTGGFALLMEPRTGKTKVAIDVVSILHQKGRISRVVVVCPVSVMGVWMDEIRANCPHRRRVTLWDKEGRKRYSLPPHGQGVLDFVIVNYDAFSVPGRRTASGRRSRSRGGKIELKRMLKRWNVDMMILDEMHRIKSPSAAKTRTITSVSADVDLRLGLTGTVQTKKKRVVDIYSQWQFINPQSELIVGHTAATFKQEYSHWLNQGNYSKWLRPRNETRLRRLLHREAYAITRLEAYGPTSQRLPDQIIPVQLTGHTREVYAEMADNMIAKLLTGEITEAQIRLVLSLRLQQITSGLAKTTGDHTREARLVRIGRDKLDTFEGIASDLFEADEKLVVGARFHGDIDAVRAFCAKVKVPCFELHGRVKGRAERDSQILGFRRSSGPALFVMQPQAGSLGIDLSTASIFIWYSLTNSWVDFTQAEDRIALFPGPRIHMYLEATGTVDRLLYETMQEDGDIGRTVMRRPERLWEPD